MYKFLIAYSFNTTIGNGYGNIFGTNKNRLFSEADLNDVKEDIIKVIKEKGMSVTSVVILNTIELRNDI